MWLFLIISLFIAVSRRISWLLYLYFFSYIKLAITLIKYIPQVNSSFSSIWIVLFCSLAILDPRVGHTMDVLSPYVPVLCHSD